MSYEPKIKSEEINEFFKSILKLENETECYKFFEDICTVKELESIAQRLQVARLLRKDRTYNYIENKTGASTATISRVSRALNYGTGGYNVVLDKMDELED